MILFLDFDGVLHRNAVYLEKRRPVLKAEGFLFMWSEHLINALDPFPEIEIVLSTSWVRARGYSRARKALPKLLRDRVIGATWHSSFGRSKLGGFKVPHCTWDELSRYEQIARYVHRAKLTNWVAIDDNGEGWPLKHADKLILTDPNKGIADPAALVQLRARLSQFVGVDRGISSSK